jgi:hypothetical protein
MAAKNLPIVDVAGYVCAMTAQGRPAADLARRCRIGVEEVDRILAGRRIKGFLAGKVRNRAAAGWTAAAIAEGLRLDPDAVRAFLSPPPPPPPAPVEYRRIWGRMGTKVRRLHFEGGYPAAAIAEGLRLDPALTADFLARLTPRQNHHRRRGPSINRPRSRREQEALREWLPNRSAGDRDGVMLPELPAEVPDLVEVPEPTAWEGGPINPKVGKVDGTPVRRGPAGREGRKAPAVAAASPPATSPVPGPRPNRWREPKGNRSRRGNADQRARDRVMLPAPPAPPPPPAIPGPTAWGRDD